MTPPRFFVLPEWRERLGEVAAKYGAWTPVAGRWAKLSELFEAKRFDELNALLTEAA